MVVHSQDGLDEISVAAKTWVAELKHGQIHEWQIDPADYDMDHASLDSLSVSSAQDSLNIIKAVFANNDGAAKDIVCLNAGAAIYVAGLEPSYAQGVARARKVLAEGLVSQKLNQFIEQTQTFKAV